MTNVFFEHSSNKLETAPSHNQFFHEILVPSCFSNCFLVSKILIVVAMHLLCTVRMFFFTNLKINIEHLFYLPTGLTNHIFIKIVFVPLSAYFQNKLWNKFETNWASKIFIMNDYNTTVTILHGKHVSNQTTAGAWHLNTRINHSKSELIKMVVSLDWIIVVSEL